MNPKLYMAGKIAANGWRHQFIPGLRGAESDTPLGPFDPKLTIACDGFDYVGPFFISCDHGCSHGPSSHGVGQGCYSEEKWPSERAQAVVLASFARICRADIVLAWINALDCYATLAELGYAQAQGKFIELQFDRRIMPALGFEPGFKAIEKGVEEPSWGGPGQFDMWFIAEMADSVAVLDEPAPWRALEAWRAHKPVERAAARLADRSLRPLH